MIKLVFCLRRRPELSRAEFQRYWFDVHGPLVRRHAAALAIRRYVQVHTSDAPLNAVLRDGRGAPEEFDGIAELWFDDVETLAAAATSAAGQAAAQALHDDERQFIDHARSPLWLAEERPVIGDD